VNHKIDINGYVEEFDFDKVAKQSNGAVLYRINDTVILATVVMGDEPIEEEFLPLMVQYIEKAYAARKIPGGFVKRETKPGDFETLTSRIIDRSIRPLFPKGFCYPVQMTLFVLSVDEKTDLQVAALNAASAALYVSDIPVDEPIYAVRVGSVDGKFVLNTQEESTLDLFVAGTKDNIVMIEMKSNSSIDISSVDAIAEPAMATVVLQKNNAIAEEKLLEAIAFAKEAIVNGCNAYLQNFAKSKKEPKEVVLKEEKVDEEIYSFIEQNLNEQVKAALLEMSKSERALGLAKIAKEVAQEKGWDQNLVEKVLAEYKKRIVRELILKERKRVDGRKLDEVRPITIETNILPSVHGSCLFTRGQTQALVVTTLGGDKDSQMFELLTKDHAQSESFMVHYNFPGFSVGEAKPIGAPGRRELGHGNLAKRALESSLVANETVRLVSEILESNGSSSMATVCGGCMALRATGLEMTELIAGVAMGLITEGNEYAILTDIIGLEDADGDMDFKVAGSRSGITAMQMDIKLGGINMNILEDALMQAKKARMHILDLMEEAENKIVLNEKALPSYELFRIDPAMIASVIGKAGSTIKKIIEKFDVTIDLDRDKGVVKLAGDSKESVGEAKKYIENLTKNETPPSFKEGGIYRGKVSKIVDFGAFVEIDGYEALLHISKISKQRVNSVSEYLQEGDEIEVVVLSQKGKKVELATKEFLQ